jgi:hypothetical protein
MIEIGDQSDTVKLHSMGPDRAGHIRQDDFERAGTERSKNEQMVQRNTVLLWW